MYIFVYRIIPINIIQIKLISIRQGFLGHRYLINL